MNHPEHHTPQATANSLARWCLRALHQSCDSMLYNHLHSEQGDKPLDYSRHQGPPPLRFSCIAPYCQHWQSDGENSDSGCCTYRQSLTRPAVPSALFDLGTTLNARSR
ncbi:MAG: hypothetical protein D3M94_01425 [Rhodocyclales bacterium GT-UBC]|nr:MAG: hypothetical protein D3M94_01425 [Rhodocyclales bacterium GT-UBC]